MTQGAMGTGEPAVHGGGSLARRGRGFRVGAHGLMHVRVPDCHGICLPASGRSAQRDDALTGCVSDDLGVNPRDFTRARGSRRSRIDEPFSQSALY